MLKTRLLAGAAALMIAATPVLAQTTAPTTTSPTAPSSPARPAAPAAAQPAPATQPARPATAQPAPAPAPAATPAARTTAPAAAPAATQGARVNLNTAAQADLDKLPQIGEARAKAIIAERAKGRFTSWDNFVQRMNGSVVNQTAKDAIKDRVSF